MSQILVFDRDAAEAAGWPARMIDHAEALVKRVIAQGNYGAKNAEAIAAREGRNESNAAARASAKKAKSKAPAARGRTTRRRK
jgi:hypothetical protein